MFACDHCNPKCFISSDCWWYQFKTKIVWQEMILRALYYRCLNCFCLWLFPGNEYKWIEKCRWAWTASGEIDSTPPDISMLKTDRAKEAAGRPLPAPWPCCAAAGLDGATVHRSLDPAFLLYPRWNCYSLFNLASVQFLSSEYAMFELEWSIWM